MGIFDSLTGNNEEEVEEETVEESTGEPEYTDDLKELIDVLNSKFAAEYVQLCTSFAETFTTNCTEVSDITLFIYLATKLNYDKKVFYSVNDTEEELMMSFFDEQGKEYCFRDSEWYNDGRENLLNHIKGEDK